MERLEFEKSPYNPMELSNHVARYLLAAPHVPGRRILDIACGEGWGSFLMAKHWGAAFVHAMDRSPSAIATAKERFCHPNIQWSVMDAGRLDPSDFNVPFDVVVSIETLEHLDDPEAFLGAISRLARPETLILISCPNDSWFYGPGASKNPYHLQSYSFTRFKALTERILGTAKQFYLGTKASGFAVVPAQADPQSPLDMTRALDRLQRVPSTLIPPGDKMAVDEAHALYFAGAWGPAPPDPAFTVTPMHPEKRFPLDHLRSRGMDVSGPKKKITLVADTPGWAYDNISQNIKKYLSDVFDIRIVHVVDYPDFDAAFLDLFCFHPTDHVHFFWREYLFAMLSGISGKKIDAQIPLNQALDRFCEKAVTLSIYDHLYLSDIEIEERQALFAVTDAYSVCSQRLFDLYSSRFQVGPDVILEDGVDLDLFIPENLDRFEEPGRPLVVGWAGNSRWHLTETQDPKGLHTLLKPAIQRLREKGIPVEGRYADVSEKIRPRSEMPGFYNKLDVLVCASSIEGTPNPVLEAMACGVPIVSTDVGIVPQLFGPLQKLHILPERSVDAMARALLHLAENRSVLTALSRENLQGIRKWTWKHHMTKWMLLFKIASQRHDCRAMLRKKRFLQSYMPSEALPKRFRVKEHLKKAAYRIHPDTLFWRNLKNRALKPLRWFRRGPV